MPFTAISGENAMKYRIDLHVHSLFSTDNDADPEETILRAIEIGLFGIAFTEHYHYGASEPVETLKEKYRSSIRIFRGVEFSAAEGHCLVFGADTDKMGLKYAPVADLVRSVSEAGGVVIPSHPYRPGTSLGDLVTTMNGFAGLEGCNGANMHAYNVKAIEAALSRGLPYTGGSDAHAPREVGSCYTEFFDEVTHENFIELLKAGNYRGVDTRKISKVGMNRFL
jgi:predicted metal-dependent phosphoesterase TrpH